MRFDYAPFPIRVIFGPGRFRELKTEVNLLRSTRVLILSTPTKRHLAEKVAAEIGGLAVGIFDQCREHMPEDSTNAVQTAARNCSADCVVAIGGGSTIGHSKAVALSQDVKLIHVVTTYSGSEMTPAQGFTKGGVKRTLIDLRMIADTVIYDSEMTLDLPAETSAASAMNAIAHCVEGLYGALTTPLHALYAEEGIKALSTALLKIMDTPRNIEARSKALYGAYMAGLAMLAGGGLHHHVAHMLGGTFSMSHSIAHAVALPHTANYNADAAPEALGRVARALGGESPTDAGALLFDLGTRLGIDMNLKAHSFAQIDLDRAAVLCTNCHYPNPRKPKLADIREMLQNMYEGEKPLPGDRP